MIDIDRLERDVAIPIEDLIRQAEQDAEDEYRRSVVTNAREDWIYGASIPD